MINPTLSLIVADAGSGDALATVSGGTPGRDAQFFYQQRAAQVGPKTWVSGGTATFDGTGTASLTITPGSFGRFAWQAVQLSATGLTAENLSQYYYRPLVDPDYRSVWERCILAVKDTIDGLALADITSAKIVAEWWPKILREMTPQPPCILVSPFGAEEYPPTGVNDEDDVGYPVSVVIVDRINNESAAQMSRDLLWREQISRVFRFQRLAGVGEIYNSFVQPDVVVHPDAFAHNLLVSTILFRFVSREPRGQ